MIHARRVGNTVLLAELAWQAGYKEKLGYDVEARRAVRAFVCHPFPEGLESFCAGLRRLQKVDPLPFVDVHVDEDSAFFTREFVPSVTMFDFAHRCSPAKVPDGIVAAMTTQMLATAERLAVSDEFRLSGRNTLTIQVDGTIGWTPPFERIFNPEVREMSPEQVLGRPLDSRSAQWTIAVWATAFLRKRFPFSGDNTLEIVEQVLAANLSFLEDESIPMPFKSILGRALSLEPDHRFSSLAQMREQIDALSLPGGTQDDLRGFLRAQLAPEIEAADRALRDVDLL